MSDLKAKHFHSVKFLTYNSILYVVGRYVYYLTIPSPHMHTHTHPSLPALIVHAQNPSLERLILLPHKNSTAVQSLYHNPPS